MVETGGNYIMARTDEERLRAEREHVRGQVDLFERKFKQFDTIWHTTLKRLDKAIAKIEKKKKKKPKSKPKMEDIAHIPPEGLEEILKENNDG